MVNPNFPVPDRIPGRLINEPQHLFYLQQHLANLCGLRKSTRFPGSQPVSFTHESLELLENEDFWVCEKSDGVRVMVLIVVKTTPQGPTQEVYFINRKDEFFLINSIFFPHFENLNRLLKDTILDGELVIDVHPTTLQHQLIFLAFDCIVWEGDNLMRRPLINRYGRLKDWVIKPLHKLIESSPRLKDNMPFEVKLKPMELAYGIEKVLCRDLPKLRHGTDGLIFTSATAPYRMGTDPKILKWKPPSENSIDFRLELRFPPRKTEEQTATRQQNDKSTTQSVGGDENEVDFFEKPLFILMMNCGNEGEKFFDQLEMPDEEWIERKKRREQLDNRVVEVVWDSQLETWKILRFRDDKRTGNFQTVVTEILKSIKDGVEAEEIIKRAAKIRQAWKTRNEMKKTETNTNTTKSKPHSLPNTLPQSSTTTITTTTNNPKNFDNRNNNNFNSNRSKANHTHNNQQQQQNNNSMKSNITLIGGKKWKHSKLKAYTQALPGTVASTLNRC